jgi:hypothetical protein
MGWKIPFLLHNSLVCLQTPACICVSQKVVATYGVVCSGLLVVLATYVAFVGDVHGAEIEFVQRQGYRLGD